MTARYGSDVIAETLGALGIRFAAMNPGASWRGLHASLVERTKPQLIMTLQENVAVAIAHGYAKATGEPMAAILHNVVGAQTGLMGLGNAWLNSTPMLVLGGSGPADHMERRPWIDWIHSARPQSLVVREFVKWDDEPVSVAGIPTSLLRAHKTAVAAPQGPTYVALDALLQEQEVTDDLVEIPAGPDTPGALSAPRRDVERLAELLLEAERPVLLADHVGRSHAAFDALRMLAEALWAPVVDCGGRHNFPTEHPLDQALRRPEVLADADLVLALDVRDLTWALSTVDHAGHGYRPAIGPGTKVTGISLTDLTHRGFLTREAVRPAELMLTADTAHLLPELAELVAARAPEITPERRTWVATHEAAHAEKVATLRADSDADEVTPPQLVDSVWRAVSDGPWQLAYAGTAPGGQTHPHVRSTFRLQEFNCALGPSGGAGLGYGLGAAIGAALAHLDDDTLVVSLQSDGDAMYTPQALWTAAHHDIPLLVVVLNNHSYGQDRMHQTHVHRHRGLSLEHVAAGIDLTGPEIDFAQLARAQGVQGFGPITTRAELDDSLAQAVELVRTQRRPVLVDVPLPAPQF